jgi:5-methylcytosine-specific restriction endonuclease McrA
MPYADPVKRREANRLWARKYRENNRELVNAAAKEYYHSNPAYRARAIQLATARQESNPEAKRASGQRYYQNHKVTLRSYYKSWTNTPDGRRIRRELEQRRHALKTGAPGEFTKEQWLQRKSLWGGKCWLNLNGCASVAGSIDHVIPLSKGGTNWPANLRPACRSCNSKKNAQDWRKYV